MHEKKQINGAELREMSVIAPGKAHQVVIADRFLRVDAGKKTLRWNCIAQPDWDASVNYSCDFRIVTASVKGNKSIIMGERLGY